MINSPLIKRVIHSHFLRAVFTLGVGDIASHLVIIGATPLLTRLYTPTDFSIFALFSSVIYTLLPGASGKMEVAIVSVKRQIESKSIFELTLLCSFIFCAFFWFTLLLFSNFFINIFSLNDLGVTLYLAPITLFILCCITALKYFANRHSKYKLMSVLKLFISFTNVGFSALFYFMSFPAGLVWAFIIANIVGGVWILRKFVFLFSTSIFTFTPLKKGLLKKYKGLLMFNAPTAFLNGAFAYLPIFFFAKYYNAEIVGFYSLLVRVAVGPLTFISEAVSRINLKKITALLHTRHPITPYFFKVSLLLLTLVLPLMLFMIYFAPILFRFLFGQVWETAGEYLQILMPAFALRFVVSTLSTTFGATGRHGLGAIWKIFSFITVILTFTIYGPTLPIRDMLYLYTYVDMFLYFIYYSFAWICAKYPAYKF